MEKHYTLVEVRPGYCELRHGTSGICIFAFADKYTLMCALHDLLDTGMELMDAVYILDELMRMNIAYFPEGYDYEEKDPEAEKYALDISLRAFKQRILDEALHPGLLTLELNEQFRYIDIYFRHNVFGLMKISHLRSLNALKHWLVSDAVLLDVPWSERKNVEMQLVDFQLRDVLPAVA